MGHHPVAFEKFKRGCPAKCILCNSSSTARVVTGPPHRKKQGGACSGSEHEGVLELIYKLISVLHTAE